MCGNPFKPFEKAISRGDRLCRLCRRPPPPPRQGRRMLVVSWIMTRVRIWEKHRVVCGFSWLLRVIDHEAVLMDLKLFSSWVHRSVVLLKRGFGRQTSSRWRFSRKNDWIVHQVTPHQAIKAIPVPSTRKIVTGGRSWGGTFYYDVRRRIFALYGGVRCVVCCGAVGGEFQ
jgi:hypothetical protein